METAEDIKKYEDARRTVHLFEQRKMQAPENCFAFNINHAMLVKLTEDGYKHWLEHENKLFPPSMQVTMESLKERADKEGYIEFNAWGFMNIFGSKLAMGFTPVADSNVRFYKKDITPCTDGD